jgi:hypothetical protein
LSTNGVSKAAALLSRLNTRVSLDLSALSFRPPVPLVGVGISPKRVALVRVRRRRGASHLAGYGVEELPEGTVNPSLLRCTLERPATLVEALRRTIESSAVKPGRVSLSLPDLAARVTVLALPEIPRSAKQAQELVRFRLKRTLPVRPEEMAVSFTRLKQAQGEAGYPVLAVMAIRSLLEQYELALAEAGLRVGVVSLATLDVANLCRPLLDEVASQGPYGNDTALLNCEAEYCTLMIYRRGEPIFFRCKMHMNGEGDNVGARLRGLRRELSTSLSYFVEKLGGQLPLPVLVRNTDPAAGSLEEMLADLGLTPGRSVDVTSLVTIPEEAPPGITAHLAPTLGVTAGRLR